MSLTIQHDRAKYINLEPHEVKAKGYDLCSLKYDGIWCRLIGKGSKLVFLSRENQRKHVLHRPGKNYSFELIGEFIYGSEWGRTYGLEGNFYGFDMYRLGDQDLTTLTYIERLDKMAATVDQLGRPFAKAFMKTVNDLNDMRARFVDPGGEYDGAFEGLVFAKSYEKKLEFARWKKKEVIEGTIMSFEEGNNRLIGSLGALNVLLQGNVPQRVGGGFSDELRKLIWTNPNAFKGAVIEITTEKVFESGKLRHARFERFHPEKNKDKLWNLLATVRSIY